MEPGEGVFGSGSGAPSQIASMPTGDGPLCGGLQFSAPQRGKWCPLAERWSVTPAFVLEFVPNIRMGYYRTYVCIEDRDAVI